MTSRTTRFVTHLFPVILALGFGFAGWPAAWGEEPADLRPIAPDPHPYTTERGRFVLAFTPLDYSHDRRNPERTRERTDSFALPLTVKYGVSDDLEVQVGADLYVWERVRDRDIGERTTADGFGDTSLRLKYNLWGNDGGDTAMAVLGYLTFPTGGRDVRAGGLSGGGYVPFAWEFTEGWAFEWNPGFHAARNAEDDGVTFAFSSEVLLVRELVDGLDAFIQFDYEIAAEPGSRWVGALGVGLTIELDANTVIKPEVFFGLTRSADTVAARITLVRRF